MKFDDLIELKPENNVEIDGTPKLTLAQIVSVARHNSQVNLKLNPQVSSRHQAILDALQHQISSGVPIYGVSASYGAQASRILNHGEADERWHQSQKLSDAIVHVDVSTGDHIPLDVTRAAILIRLNMLSPGYSAIRESTLNGLVNLLNLNLTPAIGRYGTLGASGDLAQNGRVLSVLRQIDDVYVYNKQGKLVLARDELAKNNLQPLNLDPKEGLAMVNGDNFSTAAASLIAYDLIKLFHLNLHVAALSIQALKGSDRDFHPLLADIRPHPGQKYVADRLRSLLEGSQLTHQELSGHKPRSNGDSVQDPYSIRCLPQYFAPDLERLESAIKTIEINANSVSDNPLWTTPETVTENEDPYQWVSGGNFLAMHMSEMLDSFRKFSIHMVKQNDRHLNRLVNPMLSNGLPANLSDDKAISKCTFKGVQTQMGMYEVYASLMAIPVNTAFGIHEELNQDITSHAMTSAIMTWEVLKITKLSIASNLMAACQAIDLRGGPQLLSPSTQALYEFTRNIVPYIESERPLGHYIEFLAQKLSKFNLPRT